MYAKHWQVLRKFFLSKIISCAHLLLHHSCTCINGHVLYIETTHRRTSRGGEGGCSPPVLKIFGQNAYDSGKSTWDKLFIESSFYNTTKWSILKRLNGSVCCRSLDASICCSFVPNLLANSQKASALWNRCCSNEVRETFSWVFESQIKHC